MAVRGSRGGAQRARTEAERARLYAARTAWHEKQLRRHRRDTVIAVVVGGLIVIGAIVSQTVLGMSTTPDPAPSAVPSDTPSGQPTPTPTLTNPPVESPAPVPTQTPDE